MLTMAPKANAPAANGEPPLPEENDDDLNDAPEPTVPLAQVLRMTGERKSFKTPPLSNFNGEKDKWKDWSIKLKSCCREMDKRLKLLMLKAEKATYEITDEALEAWALEDPAHRTPPGLQSAVSLAASLHSQLRHHCTGDAMTVVRSNDLKGNGIETYRLLFVRFEKPMAYKGRLFLSELNNWVFPTEDWQKFKLSLTEYNAKVSHYEDWMHLS